VAVLVATGSRLLGGVDYPTLMRAVSDGLARSPIIVPTSGRPIAFHFFENLLVRRDNTIEVRRRPREAPFSSYHDYVSRMAAALSSALANAPGYEPLMAVSSGYDSTAVAVLAAHAGCRRAATFAEGRAIEGSRELGDSGEATARRLGMSVTVLDRLDYLHRDDLPEAEFLATGMSGEDVSMAALEPLIGRSVLINGMVGGAIWRRHRPARHDLWRTDVSGCSLAEYRLRADFVYLPLPVFGMTEQPSSQAVALSADMDPWSVGGFYDEPIPRRIAEEAGIPRGSFAIRKRGGTSTIHLAGAALIAPASLAAAQRFAADHGETLDLRPQARLTRRQRALIRAAHVLRVPRLVRGREARRRALMHFEPRAGSLLFRWAAEVIDKRYACLRPESTAAVEAIQP
jgi:hypothetical protein